MKKLWQPLTLGILFASTLAIAAIGFTSCGEKVPTSETLQIYSTEGASQVIRKAKDNGLKVETLSPQAPGTKLAKMILNIQEDNFYVVVNTQAKKIVGGSPVGKDFNDAKLDTEFEKLKAISETGAKQMERLLPTVKGHAKLVVFSDYECPFCKKMDAVLLNLESEFGERLEVEMLNFPLPFHPQALPAAIAAECARAQGKYQEYQHALFQNQDKLSSVFNLKLAQKLGLNTAVFSQCQTDPAIVSKIEVDRQLGQFLGVNGTPSLYLNGKSMFGIEEAQLKLQIQDILNP